jgi:hypothetical protein
MKWAQAIRDRFVSPEVRAVVRRIKRYGILATDRQLVHVTKHGDYAFWDAVYLWWTVRPHLIALTKNTLLSRIVIPEKD